MESLTYNTFLYQSLITFYRGQESRKVRIIPYRTTKCKISSSKLLTKVILFFLLCTHSQGLIICSSVPPHILTKYLLTFPGACCIIQERQLPPDQIRYRHKVKFLPFFLCAMFQNDCFDERNVFDGFKAI